MNHRKRQTTRAIHGGLSRRELLKHTGAGIVAGVVSTAGGLLAGQSPPGSGLADAAETVSAASVATIKIDTSRPAPHRITRYLTGKFCEHLGSNIYQGMDAQVLLNPTLADYPFSVGQTPDGIAAFEWDREKIGQRLRHQAERQGWPEAAADRLVESLKRALACWWIPEGQGDVRPSPDTGPQGGRAQRIELAGAGGGIAQWAFLPLHRQRQYEVELLARSPDLRGLEVALYAEGSQQPCARAAIGGLSDDWQSLRATLTVPASSPADAIYRFMLSSSGPGQLVVARVLLRPADHIHGADPDVVRLLRQSRLPILRWPGGNFVSGYHWEDGVGPLEARPARPNFAWGGVEPNLFGTDEFIAFCRAVGCEPMICINAGSGTPEEAARWIEYCNAPADSPMGRRRAANGHVAPYGVRHWEIGNELWGKWQFYWTTSAGHLDRYRRFYKAMVAADPNITLYACGAPMFSSNGDWNKTLIRGAAPQLSAITDHPLIGGSVPADTEPLDVYRDFMVVPDVLAAKWAELEKSMKTAGIEQPRLAVTELQMFAGIGKASRSDAPVKLEHENLVNPATLAEALYDVLIYHRVVKLAPFVSMVTHSATVNHGGGLRKQRQRVYANPCHYAMAGFADFCGATPVAADVVCAREQAPRVLADVRRAGKAVAFDLLDALAAVIDDKTLLISLVHRGTAGPLSVSIDLGGFPAAAKADVQTLSASVPWATNTLEQPEAVRAVHGAAEVREGKLAIELKPYTWVRLRLPSK